MTVLAGVHERYKRCSKSALLRLFVLISVAIVGLFVVLHDKPIEVLNANISFEALSSFTPKDLESAPQELPALVTYIQQHHMKLPSNGPYNLTKPERKDFSQYGQSKVLANLLKNRTGGVFVEVGGYDGETHSNTLYLERELGWSGMLIEPNPISFKKLSQKGRKCHAVEACLSLVPFPQEVRFKLNIGISHIVGPRGKQTDSIVNVMCFPLYSILLAFNHSPIDLLTLDLEGVEVKVLKTIPWEKVDIRMIMVEVNHIPEGVPALTSYLNSKGYIFKRFVTLDNIYVKEINP